MITPPPNKVTLDEFEHCPFVPESDMFIISKLLGKDNNEEKDDKIPEVSKAITKTGDLWLLGNHRVLCGDATKKEDVERLMDGQKADMVFTDPPYGLGGYAGRSGKFEPIKGDDEDVIKFYNCFGNGIEPLILIDHILPPSNSK